MCRSTFVNEFVYSICVLQGMLTCKTEKIPYLCKDALDADRLPLGFRRRLAFGPLRVIHRSPLLITSCSIQVKWGIASRFSTSKLLLHYQLRKETGASGCSQKMPSGIGLRLLLTLCAFSDLGRSGSKSTRSPPSTPDRWMSIDQGMLDELAEA